ncbi:MAG: hypothetical protein J6X43_03125, partial [Bacteroidales bacterium]|nr:hypothetical protein [Bacteroidales bacterium]
MKKCLFFIVYFFTIGNAFSQLYKPINGGYDVSACVNTEGKVYVCGNNRNQLLGIEDEAEIITSFTEVSYFTENDIHVTQVSVDGTLLLALDCEGNVYEWGEWGNRIISPQRVPSGCVQGTIWDDNGYLTNVISVYSQGLVAFALLSDHRVVSWGYADEYSPGLGNGTDITNTDNPVFVNTLDGPITNVIQISSCNHAAYFLVDDDNDGKGIVFSFGTGQKGTLGRNTENMNYALPVMISETKILSNIVSISSSAGSAMALDEDGYIWTWGNNSWNGICGWGNYSSPSEIPSRVVKGETNEEDNDGEYLLARDISAGMDFCVAVTHGGKVVAWGGNDIHEGFLGIGKIGGYSYFPVYVKISEEENLSNCAAVQCGNFSAYAITTDNDIYAWGCNEYGELGIGSTQRITYATAFSLPTSCNLFSLSPTVNITPKYKLLPNFSFLPITINSGFNIGEQYASQYTIRWFKDDVLVSSGLVSEIGSTYSATDFGTYHVEVERTMNVADCKSIVEIATSEPANIREMVQDFHVENLVSNCKDSATLYATPTGNNTNAEFVWWSDAQKTRSVGVSVGDEHITIDVEDLKDSQGNTTLYVEEKAANKGIFLTQEEYQGNSSKNYQVLTSSSSCGTGFSVLSDYIVLSSIDFSARVDLGAWSASESNPITRTYEFEIEIYGAKENNGSFISDKTNIIGTLQTSFSITATSSARQEIEKSCFGEITLSRGLYFAVPKLKNKVEGMVELISYNKSYSQTISDNIDGKQITLLGIEAWGNPSTRDGGTLYNFVFSTPSEFTNLVPIIVASECECAIPKSVSISQNIENNVLCSGEIQLEPSAQDVPNLFTYEWLKDGEVMVEPVLTNQLAYTATQNGIYMVRVRNQENDACQKTAQTEISFKENRGDYVPKISLSKIDPICETSNGSITTNIKGGTEPYSIRWNDEITDKDRTNLAVGVYTITATDLYGCFDTKSITLTKNVSNMPQISANVEHAICGHDVGSISLSVTKGVQPYTYSWENGESTLERTNLSPGEYSFSVTDKYGCVSDWSTTIIPRTIQYAPEIALVSVSQEVENANLVVWQKEETQALDFYTIYRENTENGVTDFKPISTVPYTETSIFIDENTNNMQQAYKYKISATDNCGQESSLSEYHKTIHLTKGQALQGVNLIWDGYVGFDVQSYSIFRITTIGVDEIAEVSADTWTYTDLKPAAGTISYYVGVRLPQEININAPFQKAESGPFSLAISNIAEVENKTAISFVAENPVNVYAAHNAIVVENAGENQITICNAIGQTIARAKGENNRQKIFTVEAGIY